MILSTGIDITDISRIEKTYIKFKNRFLQKLLSKEEQKIFLQNNNKTTFVSKLATNWAIKEAVSKAIGCGLLNSSPLHFTDIVILKNDRNKPFVVQNEKIIKITKQLYKLDESCRLLFHISASNDKGVAIANAIIEVM